MNVTIAIDSFKGSISSIEAGSAAKEGIKRVYPEADISVFSVADGGEGTVDALVYGMNGEKRKVEVSDPIGRKIIAEYGVIPKNKTAIIEMSAAAGITLVSSGEKNPLNTTTFGVGEMIADAITVGCRNFIIGIGGSATNDGGIGMLQALGFGLLDKNGEQVPLGAKGLKEICEISDTNALPQLKECTFNIACDVNNPLCGENGCSAVFGPQKGADDAMVADMDAWLSDYAKIVKKLYHKADENYPGAGAAGGIGFAFMSFLNGTLKSGIEIVLNEIKLEEAILDADFVITGEGRLDLQTVMGKVPSGVTKLAKKNGKPVIAFSGCVTDDAVICNKNGIDAFFPILRSVSSLEEALDRNNAYANMADTAEQVFRLINTIKK